MQPDEIRLLTNERLAQQCKQQIALFQRQKSSSDSRYCYELIRRTVFRIDNADRLFLEIYEPWLKHKIATQNLQNQDDIADLTQEALLRFFKYVTPHTWSKFPTLGQLLAYLTKCGETSVLTHWRKQTFQQQVTEGLPDDEQAFFLFAPERPTERKVSQKNFRQQIWQCVERNCSDAKDYFLAKQIWLYGLKPQELVQQFADKFPQVSDIYKRKRNLVDRIKRDAKCESLFKPIG